MKFGMKLNLQKTYLSLPCSPFFDNVFNGRRSRNMLKSKNIVNIVCCLFFIMLFDSFSPAASPAARRSQADTPGPRIAVLSYHRFDEESYPATNVSAVQFRGHLNYLKDNGYEVLPLEELVSAIRNRAPLPDKAAVITVDDGFRSVYDVAWPILREFGYPFTVFLYVRGVDSDSPTYVNWDQVLEMQKAGVDFQDHTYSHNHLADNPKGVGGAAYRTWIRADLQKGARVLAKNLGEKPKYLALPYGEYNVTVQEEARNLGYEAILSQDPGPVSLATDLACIPREVIVGAEWSTIEHLDEVLNRIDLPVRAMKPPPAPLKGALVKRFGATLLQPERFERNSLGIYVTDLGWRPAKVSGDYVFIDNDKPLKRRVSRVTISGREKVSGHIAMRTWMVIRPD
jgi:peptidoglycan/xylan/chitin deacetylase (PgdA/CDA1 family)